MAELQPSTVSTNRFKALSLLDRLKAKHKPGATKSILLLLSPELRTIIYEYAFTRTPVEHYQALHYGPSANSASGLILTCRQIHDEVKALYHKDTVTNLWPHIFKDDKKLESQFFTTTVPPVISSWRKGRHGKKLKHHPEQVHQLSLLLNLTRETKTICSDYTDSGLLPSWKLSNLTDLYLRVCICHSFQWLHDATDRIMSFCIVLEMWAMHFPSLQSIHVCYCGQPWPNWLNVRPFWREKYGNDDVPLPELIFARHQVRMQSGGNWSVRKLRDGEFAQNLANKGDAVSIVEEIEVGMESEDHVKLRTVMTWNGFQAHPGDNLQQVPWKKRDVEINYYDSRTTLGEKCVRDKPESVKTKHHGPKVRITRLTRERSSTYKAAKAVRNWVESWTEHAEYLTHHPRDGGDGERGSHARYNTRR